MNRPRLFISAVSEELRSARQQVAATVRTLGFDPVTQDDFPTGHGELCQWLREQIQLCEGVIQLVGHAYGAEPPDGHTDFGRVSYTQFEFLYARQQGQKTWVIIVGDACERDLPADQLDLPRDPAHPDPAGYRAERRQLQQDYVVRLRAENHIRHHADSANELELIIRRLRDELSELHRRAERGERRVIRTLAAILVGLLLLGGGGWWVVQQVRREVAEVGEVNAAKIREHLESAAEQALQRDLAEAETAAGWEDRQRRREAAEAAHAARLQRIDALAADIAQIEGRRDASAVMREMTRILREEDVDAALAYVATQREGVLRRVKARVAQAREQNRIELEPLLTAAGLEATRGRPAAARDAYEQILALEPDWTKALAACAWFLFDESIQQETHGSLVVAVSDAARMLEIAQRLPRTDQLSADDARVLPSALNQMADVLSLRGQSGDAEQALGHYQRSLEVSEGLLQANPDSAQAARDVWVSYWRMARIAEQTVKGDAMQWWRKAFDTLDRMKREGRFLSQEDEGFLQQLRSKVQP